MEVRIEKFNHTGEGIGKTDGKVIFIPKSIPGDLVDVDIVRDCGNYYIGSINKVISKSNDYVGVKCGYYDKCGGCQIMGLSYFKQLEYKKEKVKNILKRYADMDVDVDIIPSDNVYGYRNKITLQVVDGKIGMYEYNSKKLVCVEHCLLVSEKVNNLIKVIGNKLNLLNVDNIMIREFSDKLMVQFIGSIDKDEVLLMLSNIVDVIYINKTLIFGSKSLMVNLGKYKYMVSPISFFQVNSKQTIKLYDKVKEFLGKDRGNVLDLYCGTGTIGIYVSDVVKSVYGIEINESSVMDAKSNIKLNSLDNVNVVLGDVGKLIDSSKKYDAIIVDPPRSGLDNKTKKALLKIKSKDIIYVSCDPVTLARDIKVLSELYEVKDITLVDMFPNTYHVESVIKLCLKK